VGCGAAAADARVLARVLARVRRGARSAGAAEAVQRGMAAVQQ
jgi:hypothetical protein